MKYLFGFIAFIIIVVIIDILGDISLRFFNRPFHGIDVFLAAGIIFLLLVVINLNNELQLIKQAVREIQVRNDGLRNDPAAKQD